MGSSSYRLVAKAIRPSTTKIRPDGEASVMRTSPDFPEDAMRRSTSGKATVSRLPFSIVTASFPQSSDVSDVIGGEVGDLKGGVGVQLFTDCLESPAWQ